MTDSMKFGPEWLRNLSTDSSSASPVGVGNGGSSSSSSNSNNGTGNNLTSSSSSGGGGGTTTNNNHTGSANMNNGSTVVSPSTPRNMFPEFRYGREEMLMLFDKNCNMPEILPLYRKICVEKVQIPLALTPTTEDELIQNSQVSTQRPLWMQRSPLGFSSAGRGIARGGSVERGRGMRGKPMYNTFQRSPAVFEEDAGRPGLLKSERGWYERNGSGDASIANSGSGGNSGGLGQGSDWNGSGTPHTSPRREFSNHSRNMENWRRNRNEDAGAAGEPSAEGWRNSTNSHAFGGGGAQRWARSTSWRDEDGGAQPSEVTGHGPPSNPSNPIQRSFSNLSTTLTGVVGGSVQKNSSGKHFPKTTSAGIGGGVQLSNSSKQWNAAENNVVSKLQDCEDNLPEWATDMPLEGGGSFDATGAFLGSAVGEQDGGRETSDGGIRNQLKEEKKESSDHQTKESRKPDIINAFVDQQRLKNEYCSSDANMRTTESTTRRPPTEIMIKPPGTSTDRKSIEVVAADSSGTVRSENTNSAPSLVDSDSNTQVSQSIQPNLSSVVQQQQQRRLSDHMIEAADDMVKKLINDDDLSDVEKSDNDARTYATAAAAAAAVQKSKPPMKTVGSLEQSLLAASQNSLTHVLNPNNSNNMGLPPPPPDHKGIQFFFNNIEQQQSQAVQAPPPPPPQLHQFHPANHHLISHHHEVVSPIVTHSGNAELWYYRDPQSKVQGPFAALEMTEWYRAGYFNENLLVRRACDTRFRILGDLIKTCQNNMPFTHSSLLGTINMETVPVPSVIQQQHQKDKCDELKGNVTAAADSLSAAVKNMSSVDMLHMLNVHFQMLQEQYIRRQEMAVLNELAKNEAFHRLSPVEREAIVRQKVQLNGLPEYLTSLTNLGNTLVTLNPSAGTQLFNAILECSKKDNQQQQQMYPQSSMSSNYMDVGEFISSMQRHQPAPAPPHRQPLQSPHHHHHHHHHQQQQQQQNLHHPQHNQHHQPPPPQQQQQQPIQCPTPTQFGGYEANQIRPESLLCNGLLEDLNIRMLLSGGAANNQNPPQPLIQHHLPPKGMSPQELVSNTHGFLTEQQILASNTAVVGGGGGGNTAQSPLLQMWVPSNILGGVQQRSPQIHDQQLAPPHQAQNQWINGPANTLVDIKNVMETEKAASEQQLVDGGTPSSNVPSSMWGNVVTSTQNNAAATRKHAEQIGVGVGEKNQSEISAFESQNDSGNSTISSQSQYQIHTEENLQQPSSSSSESSSSSSSKSSPNNEDNNHHQGIEKVDVQQGVKQKQKQNSSVSSSSPAAAAINQKIKENDFKKVDSGEEKKRQKEERKRQQLEEEKKRLLQLEQERRRQQQEEEERQKQIQAQRRKALLGSGGSGGNSGNANGGAASTTSAKGGKLQSSSSVAPWSAQSNVTSAASSPCLAEIQKAERRERRADQQRQLELHEKQIRLNATAALEANDAVPKWNPPSVKAKSIAEIQAEEAKKLSAEALFESQRRKEMQELQQAALNMANVNSSVGTGALGAATSWNNVAQNKFWGGSNTNNNNSNTATMTGGFWEEPVKHQKTSSSNGSSSFAAAIASGKQQQQQQQQQPKIQSSTAASIAAAAASSSRNLKKSQTVSVMQSTTTNASIAAAASKNTKAAAGGGQQQSNNAATQKQAGAAAAANNTTKSGAGGGGNTDKKGAANLKNNNNNVATNNKEDYENEFINWCMRSLSNMSTKVDVPTFVTFLRDLESPYEVKDYVRIYLGESKEFNDFSKQFLERRSKYKNLQRAQNAHNDDMCKPAPAITPSAAGNDNTENKNKQKRVKKNKMTKLDARILGFSVTAAEGRINVGDRDYVDAP